MSCIGRLIKLKGEAWEVVEELDKDFGIVVIRKLFDQSCTTDELHILNN